MSEPESKEVLEEIAEKSIRRKNRKLSTKKMLSNKNKIYTGLCALYILLSMINRKYPIGDVTLNIVYLSTWFFLLLWEVVDVLINKKKDFGCIVIISIVLVTSIANMLR